MDIGKEKEQVIAEPEQIEAPREIPVEPEPEPEPEKKPAEPAEVPA